MNPDTPTALLIGHSLGRQVAGRWIWRDLELRLVTGERLAVVGPSGSGKSLLLRALAGLDPVQQGSLLFHGAPVEPADMPRYRGRVIYLAQRPALGEGTVEQVLRRVFELRSHRHRAFDRTAALALLDPLGRGPRFLEQDAAHLSGGESQIVALVRALQLEPEVLLLDEPTASLDSDTARRFEALVHRWLDAGRERACVWTSHDAEQLARMTTRALSVAVRA